MMKRRTAGLLLLSSLVAALGVRSAVTQAFSQPTEVRPLTAVTSQIGAMSVPSPEQQAMLADGVVTEEEVRSALKRAADCLEINGVEPLRVGDPFLHGSLVLGWVVRDESRRDAATMVVRKCDEEHSAAVTSAYRVQTRGSAPWNPALPDDMSGFRPSFR